MPKQEHLRGAVTTAKLVKKYIDDHPGTNVSTAQLAREHNITRNLLQKAFKYKYRKAIGLYKLTKRMEEGRRLLRSGRSIKEVAFQLNYSSPSSFSNAFSNFYKISPSAWLHKIYKANANKQGKM